MRSPKIFFGKKTEKMCSKIENGKATISIKILARPCDLLVRPLTDLFRTEPNASAARHAITAVSGLASERNKAK